MSWNPIEQPYRVIQTLKSSAYGHYGWMTGHVSTHKTFEEAENIANTLKRGKVKIDFAENVDNWQRKGKWRKIKDVRIKY